MTTMTDNDLDALATKIAAKILERFPAANVPESMDSLYGPTPTAWNRNGASMGVMASSFQVDSSLAPPEGDLQTMRNYALRIATIAHRISG